MARTVTIPAKASKDVTQRIEKILIDYDNETIRVHYSIVETSEIRKISITGSAYDTVTTALNADRLWSYIDAIEGN